MPIVKAFDTAPGGDLFDYIETLRRRDAVAAIKARATLLSDFANNSFETYEGLSDNLTSKPFNEIFDFTRNTIATGDNALGNVEQVAANEHRLVGNRRGLLVEESRENVALYSEDLTDASWVKQGVTISADAIDAPDESTTCDRVIADSGSALHRIEQTVTLSAGDAVISFYVKKDSFRYAQILLGGGLSSSAYANFDIEKGLVTVNDGVDAFVESLPDGFFRIGMTASVSAATDEIFLNLIDGAESSRAASSTGDGTTGIYVWGAQVEEGSFVTSYIPTAASSVVRDQDNCKRPVGDEFNESQGTIYCEFETLMSADEAAGSFLVVEASDSSNRSAGLVVIVMQSGAVNVRRRVAGFTVDFSFGKPIERKGQVFKAAISISPDGALIGAIDGVTEAGASDPGFALNTDFISVGSGTQGASPTNAIVRDMFYSPEVLTADELKTLTQPD